jgi:RNA polymerase sigma factor (sigma-70 family)
MNRPFECIVAEHGETVLRVCRVVVGPVDADDAWSETFLSALRAFPDLPEDTNVQAWLVTVAHRKAIDIVRKRREERLPLDDLIERPSPIGVPGTPEDDLWDAVATLPLKQRQAVAYHYLAGLPYAEVAGLIGGTAEAARRAAADGIRALRGTFLEHTSKGSPHERQR